MRRIIILALLSVLCIAISIVIYKKRAHQSATYLQTYHVVDAQRKELYAQTNTARQYMIFVWCQKTMQGTCPVIWIVADYATLPEHYIQNIEQYNAQGYCVISIHHPYINGPFTVPTGHAITELASLNTELDIQRAIQVCIGDIEHAYAFLQKTLLRTKLQLDTVGIIGYGFGDTVARAMCAQNSKFYCLKGTNA